MKIDPLALQAERRILLIRGHRVMLDYEATGQPLNSSQTVMSSPKHPQLMTPPAKAQREIGFHA